jgi:hypothetical protein
MSKKISELSAAAALDGTELIPIVQSGVTKRTTIGVIGINVYNIKSYGAVGDGVANDTAAIQAALDAAGVAGGGTVFVPAGVYNIRPANTTDAAALYINYDNIALVGAGRTISKLNFQLYNGGDPATTIPPPLVSGLTQRGHGIKFSASGVDTILISDLEIDGNAGNQGNNGFPADPVTGVGWDLTHKAINFGYGTAAVDNIVISDCYIHSWRGELIYSGGNLLGHVTILRCEIADSNASLISLSATYLLVSDCNISDTANVGIENVYFTEGFQKYVNNAVVDCARGGIVAFAAQSTMPHAFSDISGNFIRNCGNVGGVYLPGGRNTRVYDNTIVDCAQGVLLNFGLGGSGNDFVVPDNVEIYNNRIVADLTYVASMVTVGTVENDCEPTRIHIHDNYGVITQKGVALGGGTAQVFQAIADFGTNGFFWGEGCKIERNYIYGDPGGGGQEDTVVPSITQITSKSTSVTLTETNGSAVALTNRGDHFSVVTHNATLNAGAIVGFTVNNIKISATDTVVVSIASGATPNSYVVFVDAVADGSCHCLIHNISGSNLSEALVINFTVIRGAVHEYRR